MHCITLVKNTPPIGRTLLLSLLTAGLAMASVAQGQDQRILLPDMGNSAENYLSDGEEREYAEAIIMQLRAYEMMVEDPLIAGYFSDMGFRLVSNSDKPDKPFRFVVLDEERVNAFAAPGGVVALHSGLILEADDEDEVAGVVAHEIAHITQLHLYRTLESTQNLTIPIALGMLAIILAGGGSGQAITGALMSGQAMSSQAYINFTRANEEEADRIGIHTLSEAGYDPEGMADFFERMAKISRAAGEGPPEFLRTHPVTTNRIAEAKNRAANMPDAPIRDGLNFYLAQARLRALLERKPKDAITWFRDKLEEPYSESRTRAHMYGLAISLQRYRELEESRELLNQLLTRDPYHLAYQLQMADLNLQSDRVGEAMATLEDLHLSFPGNRAIAIPYAEALLDQGGEDESKEAGRILRQLIVTYPDDANLHELYARALSVSGEEARSTEALAESYFWRGNTKEAVRQLEQLLDRDDLDYYQRARATARLEEIRIIISEFGEIKEDKT